MTDIVLSVEIFISYPHGGEMLRMIEFWVE